MNNYSILRGQIKEKKCALFFHKAQLRCEGFNIKTHIAQEVNIAQLEEVTQVTVNRILESALVMTTSMTCSARGTNLALFPGLPHFRSSVCV